MSDSSPILALPYIQPAQAQKHVTHNEGMRILDAVAQLSVISVDQTSPPPAPASGDRYVVGPVALGDWADQDASVAVFDGAGWSFLPPREGWIAWVKDISALRIYDGSGWVAVPGFGDVGDTVGINTSADTTNRLAVSAPATLLTHEGAGHQLKINKASQTDTASLLFQTNWGGRAEMGTAGSDDFEIKVSADGASFRTGLRIKGADGSVYFPQGVTTIGAADDNPHALVARTEVWNTAHTLVRNGFGGLGGQVNKPDELVWDDNVAPDIPASLSYAGYNPGRVVLPDLVPVNPNQIYKLQCSVRQESVAGDWSGFANGERHGHFMGLLCFDRDGLEILPKTHMRYRSGGTDSLTTLATPLRPGDEQVVLADASGWNDSDGDNVRCGIIVFGYKDSTGRPYDFYSRYVETGLFDETGVNKATNVVTLNQPLPASLANPDDPDGEWPVGTPVANSDFSADKFSFFKKLILPETDSWYRTTNFIGGIDRSGTDQDGNFAPGTAAVKIFMLPNQTNRPGGFAGSPDTGDQQRIWFAGITLLPAEVARLGQSTLVGEERSYIVYVPTEDTGTGVLSMAPADLQVELLNPPNI